MNALACDYDGTFYFMKESEPIHPYDVEAVKTFQTHGHLFGFCTGRPLYGLLDYLENKVQADFYILNSGATIYDKNLNLIYEKTIPKEITNALITYGEQSHFEVDFHMDGKFYTFGKSNCFITDEIYSLDEITGSVHNITYNTFTEETADLFVEYVNNLFPGQVSAYRNTHFVDIVPFGCSKGAGIDFVRNHFRITMFAGIGDSMNDYPMFEKVNYSYTFPYAPAILQEKANCLVTSVEEAIKQLL